MRLRHFPFLLSLLLIVHAIPVARYGESNSVQGTPGQNRDLGSLLGGGGDEPDSEPDPDPPQAQVVPKTTQAAHPTSTADAISGLLTEEGSNLKTTKGTPTSTTSKGTATTTSLTDASASPTPSSAPMTTTSTAASSGTMAVPTDAKPAPTGINGESIEWKVIGVTVIAVSVIGLIILITTFFDQWWRFVKEVIFGRKHNDGVEDLLPDWEKRSWEFKLAGEDSRYPTIESLPSESRAMQDKQQIVEEDTRHPFPARPSPAHLPKVFSPQAEEESVFPPTHNFYQTNHQPGAENMHAPVQLPSANIFGDNAHT